MIETIVATAIFAVAMAAIFNTFKASQDAMYETALQTDADMTATTLADQIADDLRDCDPNNVTISQLYTPVTINPSVAPLNIGQWPCTSVSFVKTLAPGYDANNKPTYSSLANPYKYSVEVDAKGAPLLVRYEPDVVNPGVSNKKIISDSIFVHPMASSGPWATFTFDSKTYINKLAGFDIQRNGRKLLITVSIGKLNYKLFRKNPVADDPTNYQFSTATTTVSIENP